MNAVILKLREAQTIEMAEGFKNGNLWNDLEDMIYSIENPKNETVSEGVSKSHNSNY